MALSLVLFYAPSRYQGTAVAASNTEVVARVGGDEITVGDLNRQKEAYTQQFGGQISLAQLGLDERTMLNGIIRGKVVAQEAERLGLAASDAEVAAKIWEQFKDPSGKFVGEERYRSSVTARFAPASARGRLREEIAAESCAPSSRRLTVEDKEVEDDAAKSTTSIDSPRSPPTAAEKIRRRGGAAKYFDETKASFAPRPQKKIR